jgi:hypothetical protein
MDLIGYIVEPHCALSALVLLGGFGGFVLLGNLSLLILFAEV